MLSGFTLILVPKITQQFDFYNTKQKKITKHNTAQFN